MLILKGDATSVTPRMHVMFKKQLPTIFPKARSKWPFLTASKLVANSGTLVPKATTVAPIITGGTPTAAAILEADSTMKKELITTPTAPKIVNKR